VPRDAAHDDLERARLLLATRRFKEGCQLAYECSARQPDDPAPLLVAAGAEIGMGDPVLAERTAGRAVGLVPESPGAHAVLAEAILGQAWGKPRGQRLVIAQRALGSARESLRLAPGDQRGLSVAARAAAAAGHLPEAVAYADEAVAANPASPEAWLVRAQVARAARALRVAQADVGEALRLRPDYYYAQSELGFILQKRGYLRASRQPFAAAAAANPVARPARAGLLASGGWAVMIAADLLTLPVLLVTHEPIAWLIAGGVLGAYALHWRPVRSRLERWAVAGAAKQRPGPSRRATQGVGRPGAPVRPEHLLHVAYLVVLVALGLLFTVALYASSGPSGQMANPDGRAVCLFFAVPTALLAFRLAWRLHQPRFPKHGPVCAPSPARPSTLAQPRAAAPLPAGPGRSL
jgi:tetratricopeptide (TPR) repeat protein